MRVMTGVLVGLAAAAGAFSLFVAFAPAPEAPKPGTERAMTAASEAERPHGETAPDELETAGTPPAQPQVAQTSRAAAPQIAETDAAAPEALSTSTPTAGSERRPRFDIVRVDRAGAALAAGSAEPHAEITIRVDGEPRVTAKADDVGEFVAFFDVAPAPAGSARRLDIVSTSAGADPEAAHEGAPVIVTAPPRDEPDAEPLVVAAREGGIELLQRPQAEDAEESVALDAVTQDQSGVVALSGRAGGLRPIRIYANARLVAEAVADADGRWTATASAAHTAGADTLRVDEIGENGGVSRRIEAPFIAAPADPPPAPGAVVVAEGDTLWTIAENVLGSGLRYTVIYAANRDRIRDPDLIFPGQRLDLPGVSVQ